ncbi:uncharacterized protein LOC141629461 [Silene latifolia]|uniref:uncharacterized protein LOC141629461 n=1 Tax=Silene latifolia TaxID=37657 RepID=UPI003D76A531
MTSTEFDRFSSCTTAKEIWDGLELAYEGTSIVKKNRIDLLIQKYELFSMAPNETLDSMSTRFLSIINELKNLGRTFPTEDIARKVLRSLTKKWRPKVTVMEECRDLTNLSYQELIGALMAHELTLNSDEAETSTRKSMALASENNESDLEDETVLFAKRFRKKFFNFKQNKTFNNNKSSNKKSSDSKNSFANRDTEVDEESEDEEVANLCLSNISLDIDNDSNSEFCLMGESDFDEDEDEAKAKKLKSKATVDDIEALNSMANEKKALESKVIANEPIIKELKLNIKQLQDKVIANEAITIELKKLNELQKSEISAKNGTISDHKKEIDFLNKQLNEKEINQTNISKQYEEKIDVLKNLREGSSSTEIKIDHTKCNEEIQSLRELLLHARKVHDKWEGSTKVVVKENNQWYLDSGCSIHMTGDKNLFLSLKPFNGGKVTFGDNKKEAMKRYLLVTLIIARHTKFSTKELYVYENNMFDKAEQDEEEDMNELDFHLSRDDPPELEEEEKEIEDPTVTPEFTTTQGLDSGGTISNSFEEGNQVHMIMYLKIPKSGNTKDHILWKVYLEVWTKEFKLEES